MMRSSFVIGVGITLGLLTATPLFAQVTQVAQAQEMVARAPGSAIAWSELGAAYRAQGMLGESSRALREALRREPSSVRTWYELGRTAKARGDEDAVQAIHQKVRQLSADAARDYQVELLQASPANLPGPAMIQTVALRTPVSTTPVIPAPVAPIAATRPPNSQATADGGWECLSGYVMYEERRCIPMLNR